MSIFHKIPNKPFYTKSYVCLVIAIYSKLLRFSAHDFWSRSRQSSPVKPVGRGKKAPEHLRDCQSLLWSTYSYAVVLFNGGIFKRRFMRILNSYGGLLAFAIRRRFTESRCGPSHTMNESFEHCYYAFPSDFRIRSPGFGRPPTDCGLESVFFVIIFEPRHSKTVDIKTPRGSQRNCHPTFSERCKMVQKK